MGHLHSTELQEGLSQSYPAEQHLPVADVAGAVFVCRAAGSSADAVNVLVTLRRVFGKVNPGSEHPADVGVPLVKAFMDDGVYKRRTVEQHALVVMVVVLVSDLFLPMCVSLPQLLIHHLLNLDDVVSAEDSSCIPSISVLTDCTLHLLLDGLELLVVGRQVDEDGALSRAVEGQVRVPTLLTPQQPLDAFNEFVSVSVSVYTDLLQLLMTHISQHVQSDLLTLEYISEVLQTQTLQELTDVHV